MMSGVELVGLILAVPAVVQLFFKTAEKIHEKMKNDRRMKDQAQDLGRLVVGDSSAQLNRDFELARGILKDESIGKEEKERISRLFSAALDQLQHINDSADVVQSSDRLEFRKRSAALRDMKDRVIDIRVSLSEFHQLVMSLHTIAISESILLLEDQDFILIGPGNDQ
jgi:phosphoenolpyruvate-protein kinase (PTS system EI component)